MKKLPRHKCKRPQKKKEKIKRRQEPIKRGSSLSEGTAVDYVNRVIRTLSKPNPKRKMWSRLFRDGLDLAQMLIVFELAETHLESLIDSQESKYNKDHLRAGLKLLKEGRAEKCRAWGIEERVNITGYREMKK